MSIDARLAAALAERSGRLLLDLRATAADLTKPRRCGDSESNVFLLSELAVMRPDDAVLSEESADDPARLDKDRVWIIDPLDGTREFSIPGRNDWAVHVALWQAGRGITAAAVRARVRPRPVILVSDSRPPEFAASVATDLGADLVPMGSAGAKAMAVMRGEADAYLHAGGQWEWDSAAPVGVALAAGLHASRISGAPLEYNTPHPYLPDILICRPDLAERLLTAIATST